MNPIYDNFINNYLIHNKKKEDGSMEYSTLRKDCSSNSLLEKYNEYIKNKLGKYRKVNSVNFMNFIKEEIKKVSRSYITLLEII